MVRIGWGKPKKKNDDHPPPPGPVSEPAAAKPPVGMGLDFATFALETIEPVEGVSTTLSALWERYVAWCDRRNEEPVMLAIFDEEFALLAREAGIHRAQSGANVYFHSVALNTGWPKEVR